MSKKVIVSGLLGGLVLIIWTFVVNGLFGFNLSVNMKQIPNERQVYKVLKENVIKPGRYTVNPELTSDMRFPGYEPVFGVLYGGMGHESAGELVLVGLVVYLVVPIIGAWMLSQTSERVLSSYPRKVLFFVAIGLLFALFTDLLNYGIGDYPLRDALLLAAHSVLLWTAVGLVVAWQMKPKSEI